MHHEHALPLLGIMYIVSCVQLHIFFSISKLGAVVCGFGDLMQV